MHFEIYVADNGEYAWRLRAGNGKIVADGAETYKRKADCEGGLELFRRLAPDAPVNDRVAEPGRGQVTEEAEFELYRDVEGDYRWRFQQGGNSEILADSGEGYESKSGCEAAIERVKRLAPEAPLRDETRPGGTGGFTPREEPSTVGGGRFS